jgi:hypothetical protein
VCMLGAVGDMLVASLVAAFPDVVSAAASSSNNIPSIKPLSNPILLFSLR